MGNRIMRGMFLGLMAMVIASGCSEVKNAEKAELLFWLTDMPGEYQQVNIDVQQVNVILNDSLIELTTNQGIYNLLDFVNGEDTLIVDDEVPSGFVSQVRLVLGDANTIMVDGELHDLKTPSAQQSGLKFNVHNELMSGESYAYVIDFVVEKSIVEKGNGTYSLKPVIRVFTEAVTGSIQGVVSPADANPQVRAVNDNDTASTFADPVTGRFMIRGLAEALYNVEFFPEDGYSDTILHDIQVMAGHSVTLDTMFLQ